MPEKCAGCRWWEPKGTEHALRGSCLFLPPKIQNVIVGEEDTYFVYSYFPETNRNQRRCGRFAAREMAKEETEVVGTGAFPGEAIAGNVAAKSPLAERGFRLIDKELWEKEVAPKPLTKPPTSTVEEKIAGEMKRADAKSKDPWNETGEAYDKGRRDGLSFALDLIRSAPPKEKRWMVDVRENKASRFFCSNCKLEKYCYDGADYIRPNNPPNSCPAREVECDI